jgi:hypothetical protein
MRVNSVATNLLCSGAAPGKKLDPNSADLLPLSAVQAPLDGLERGAEHRADTLHESGTKWAVDPDVDGLEGVQLVMAPCVASGSDTDSPLTGSQCMGAR